MSVEESVKVSVNNGQYLRLDQEGKKEVSVNNGQYIRLDQEGKKEEQKSVLTIVSRYAWTKRERKKCKS